MSIEVLGKNKKYIELLAKKKGINSSNLLALLVSSHRLGVDFIELISDFKVETKDKEVNLLNQPLVTPLDRGVSDVQKAALDGILAIKKVPFDELLVASFKAANISTSTMPSCMDDLSYAQATAVIKYGKR